MFQVPSTQKKLHEETVIPIDREVCRVLSFIDDACSGAGGLAVDGLSISQARQGGGWLAILRVIVEDTADFSLLSAECEPGSYVVYSHGDSVLGALASLEASLRLGTARLTPDKFAEKRVAQRATGGRHAKKNTSKPNG